MPPNWRKRSPTKGPRDARPDDQSGARWAMTPAIWPERRLELHARRGELDPGARRDRCALEFSSNDRSDDRRRSSGPDPTWPGGRSRRAKRWSFWGPRANPGLLKALCVDQPNLRAPAIHPQGGARQAYSARSKRCPLVGDNYWPAGATRRSLRSLEGFQHSSSCGQRLHPIVPAVVSRNPHPCLSSQQA
jgi:hypothetical protein